MQYAGLKDVNDKDIYEGDIVDLVYEDFDPVGESYYREENSVPVVYEYEFLSYLGYADKIEIIGNIYENPELISE